MRTENRQLQVAATCWAESALVLRQVTIQSDTQRRVVNIRDAAPVTEVLLSKVSALTELVLSRQAHAATCQPTLHYSGQHNLREGWGLSLRC